MWQQQRMSLPLNATAWSDDGPGIVLVAYQKNELPPEIVDSRNGIEFAFLGDGAFSFEGKRLLIENDEIKAV
jgi:hypothetical protein